MNELMEEKVEMFRSPISKLARFFHRSRDKWKQKYREVKRQRKLLGNQVRAVEKSRAQWRALAEQREQRVTVLERELEELKRLESCH